MHVRKLILNHFRNYDHLELEFPQDATFLSGDNGIGKTNILESIYYLTMGRSFRRAEDQSLIQKGFDQASIYLIFQSEKDQKEHSISCLITKRGKMFSYDDQKVKSLSKILGKLSAICYDPSLVFFFKGEPAERRKLLDQTLCQLDPKYLYALSRYRLLIKERNTALQRDLDPDIIRVYRDELINVSYRIVKERKDLIRSLEKPCSDYYKKLFGENHELKLLYKTSCSIEDEQEFFAKEMTDLFVKNKSIENIKKVTVIGPHRDDLMASLDGNELLTYGSQGENRIATLSLKLALLDRQTTLTGERPILLLDDVTSDLDAQRTKNLLSCIQQDGQQIFVTGTAIRKEFVNYDVFHCDGKTAEREV